MSLPHAGRFQHAGLIVDSDEALRERLVPAIRRSLAAGIDVVVVVSRRTARVLCGALGGDARRVEWAEQSAFYQRLGFTFDAFRRYLASRHAAGRSVHLVAEPDVTMDISPRAVVDRVAAFLPYEAVCNETFAAYASQVTCLWDGRRHPTLVLENARALHTHELAASGPVPNPDYVDPVTYLAGRNQVALEPPPATLDFDARLGEVAELGPLRATLRRWTRARGFTEQAGYEVLAATMEVVSNGFQHGTPPVRVRAWQQSDTLVVHVDDAGGRPLPPTAGYQPPGPWSRSSLGLWMARQLADAVTSYTGHGVTSVRLHFPREITHRHPPGW